LPDGKSEIIIVALKSDKGKPRESTGRKVNGLPTPNVRLWRLDCQIHRWHWSPPCALQPPFGAGGSPLFL